MKGVHRIAKSDGTVSTNLYKMFGVEGYPTVFWLDGDKAYTYSGERTQEKLQAFVEVSGGGGGGGGGGAPGRVCVEGGADGVGWTRAGRRVGGRTPRARM